MRAEAKPIALCVTLLALLTATALARPVRIGAYVEIPYGVPRNHPYASSRGDDRRTGRARAKAPRSAPTKQWEMPLRANVIAAPAVLADGRVAVGSSFGITMLSPGGEVLFGLAIGTVATTPAITPESEVLAAGLHGLVVRAAPSGGISAETQIGAASQSSLLVLADGSFVVVALDQALHRFDAAGSELFRTPLPRLPQTEIARSNSGEIVLALGGELTFFSTLGEPRNAFPVGSEIVAGPAIADDGTIWVATADRTVLAIGEGGSIRARATIDAELVGASIAVARDGSAWIAPREADVTHIAPSGSIRHRIAGHTISSAITLDEDGVLLGVTDRSRLVAIEPDGTIRFAIEVGQRVLTAPVIATDSTIYLVNPMGTVSAYR